MKVKEVAEFLKVTTEELLKLLKNVSVGKVYNEDSDLDKELEKKLAKRYGVPYPFKSKPKAAPAKPVPAGVKVPTTPKPAALVKQAPADKPQAKPAPADKPQAKPTPVKPEAKQGGVKQSAKPQPQKPQAPKAKPEVKQAPAKQPAKPQPQKPQAPKARPSDIQSYKDEIVETLVDEEFLDKYDEFLEDGKFESGGNNRIKQKVRTGEKVVSKKPKQQKSRAEKLAGSIEQKKEENVLYYELNMTVMDVAEELGISVTDLVKKLFTSMGIFASATQTLDRDTIELIAMEYNFEVKDKQITDLIRFDEIEIEDNPEDLEARPAIVTIMGHVDHGKTTLLDTIRSSHVVRGEAGGITQHIGAYQVQKDGRLITFIDTPGHAAFTEMRARGAQVTDIVILVVAADDGMMPQTKEAIEHAQAAGVPIIVAINKMDKPTANPDRVKQELMTYNLVAEEWGGDTIFVPISALTGKGVDDLLEMVILLSDMKEYKANPKRLGVGTVIEARLDKGRGPVATLLVQNGSLRVGDMIVVGTTYGRVRAMQDELGRQVKVAGPAKPVEITGIAEVPFAGEKFMALDDERKARAIAEVRAQNKFNEEMGSARAASLNEIMSEANGDLKVLNLIIKCDVQGSI